MEPSVDDVPIVTVIVQDWQPQQVPIKDQTAASPASAHTSQDAAVIDIPVQQDQQQTRTGGLCRTLAAAARIYRTPECWGRPDDTKKTLPEQWELRQSKWRFINALVPYMGPPTLTLSRIWLPFVIVMCLTAVINSLAIHTGWQLDQHKFALTLYRTSQFVLALLLAFRLNRTYDRWWQARSAFGGIGGGMTNVVRQIATYTDDPVLIREAQKWSMCMVYGVLQLINNTPKVTDARVIKLLEADELAMYNSTTKPAKLCGTMLSALVSSAGFNVEQETYLNSLLGQVAGNVGIVARIKLQALPYGMSLFCSGWTFIWLLLLPFGIIPDYASASPGATWWSILPISVMTIMMLGLEDLAAQLEDPFKFIPFEAMAATTAKDMPRTVAEVQACKELIQHKYSPMQAAAAAGQLTLPSWPELKARPQLAG